MRCAADLEIPEPYDAAGVFGFLAVRAVSGVEVADIMPGQDLRYARTLMLPHGPAAVEIICPATGPRRMQVTSYLSAAADEQPAVDAVRHLLDLDRDAAKIDDALATDPALSDLVRATPGIRVPGSVDAHEIVVRALVGQQISVAAARTHLGRLAAELGRPFKSGIPSLQRLFPSASRIAEGVSVPADGQPLDPMRPLRLPRRSLATVAAICRSLSSGTLVIDEHVDRHLLQRALIACHGVGPWTAAYVAMRVSHDPDAWLARDVALMAGARRIGLLRGDLPKADAHRALEQRAAAWSPWRSYAAMHLWRAASKEHTRDE